MSPQLFYHARSVMIRLPPSAIILGRSDLKDFEKRRQQRLRDIETENINQEFARFAVGAPEGPTFRQYGGGREESDGEKRFKGKSDGNLSAGLSNLRAAFPTGSFPTASRRGHAETRSSDELNSTTTVEDGNPSVAVSLPDDECNSTVWEPSPENTVLGQHPLSSPSKDDFHYGGFVETPVQFSSVDSSRKYSPFSPDDLSTPQNAQHPDSRRLRPRVLPRSPLFISQNASSSPERRPTSRLTPRVVSRQANYNSPGILFAQPPRRPPRSFRHQTNSFSFDSSERASAAYEQERVSSASTDGSTHRPSDDISLHEELRGSSLQSSRVTSRVSLPSPANNGTSTSETSDGNEEIVDSNREFIFSSPHLPLPPPFSTVPRNVSRAESLPSQAIGDFIANPATSPIRSLSVTTISTSSEPRNPNQESYPAPLESNSGVESSPPTRSETPKGLLKRTADRLRASCRVRSPRGYDNSHEHPSPSPSPSPTPRQSQGSQVTIISDPRTPSRTYQVYNDSLSPETQPQTPAQLPEARHQSRFHPSYTAPVARGAIRRVRRPIINSDGAGSETRAQVSRFLSYTPSRTGRAASPIGLIEGGFQGLYGGMENGDDEQNWVQGVRFNSSETRIFNSRGIEHEGMRDTPEPEDWRIGRRE